jgi:hypothetical protein
VACLLTTEGDSPFPGTGKGGDGVVPGRRPAELSTVGLSNYLLRYSEKSYLALGGGDEKVMRDNDLGSFLAWPAYAFMHD